VHGLREPRGYVETRVAAADRRGARGRARRLGLTEQCYDFTVYRTANASGCVTGTYGKLYQIEDHNLRLKIHCVSKKEVC